MYDSFINGTLLKNKLHYMYVNNISNLIYTIFVLIYYFLFVENDRLSSLLPVVDSRFYRDGGRVKRFILIHLSICSCIRDENLIKRQDEIDKIINILCLLCYFVSFYFVQVIFLQLNATYFFLSFAIRNVLAR